MSLDRFFFFYLPNDVVIKSKSVFKEKEDF